MGHEPSKQSERPWLHDRELEDAAMAALRERKRLRPTTSRNTKQGDTVMKMEGRKTGSSQSQPVLASNGHTDSERAAPRGPWCAEPRDYDDTWNILDVHGEHVASVPNPFEHLGDRPDLVEEMRGATEGAARLIASAPELLDGLHDLAIAMRAVLEKPDDESRRRHAHHFMLKAEDAIANATGKVS